MAWLQSSFTNHQLLGEGVGSNHRKGYKVGALNKNTDPDKSDTPLLQDSSSISSVNSSDNSSWLKDNGAAAPKKQNMLLGKSGFFVANKLKEDKKLLSEDKNKTPQFEEDDESDDDWCIPHTSGGYQKVKSGAD
ncbi:hypothetical protein CEXT_3561 [Caerostris extrusa]|uniref:Uncharacterized protein n=1 Tax=Caerostris extrusa TaxID=172846 RepID=A0AAV4XTM1_CAEEX|nr:hypothetical protein CEXT_3561 [Caerostris extrusa]